MLSWFRVRAPALAALALLSLGNMGASLLMGHPEDCHDAACGAVMVLHDASAHRIEAASSGSDGEPLHCLVCHFFRSFRPDTLGTFVPAPAIAAGVHLHVEIFTAAWIAPTPPPPLRSPPA